MILTGDKFHIVIDEYLAVNIRPQRESNDTLNQRECSVFFISHEILDPFVVS